MLNVAWTNDHMGLGLLGAYKFVALGLLRHCFSLRNRGYASISWETGRTRPIRYFPCGRLRITLLSTSLLILTLEVSRRSSLILIVMFAVHHNELLISSYILSVVISAGIASAREDLSSCSPTRIASLKNVLIIVATVNWCNRVSTWQNYWCSSCASGMG